MGHTQVYDIIIFNLRVVPNSGKYLKEKNFTDQ